MSDLKITDLDHEISLTELEVKGIKGGFRHPFFFPSYNVADQTVITASQANNGNLKYGRQDNVFVINYY